LPTYEPVLREMALPPSATAGFAAIASRPGAILLESGTREPRLGRWSFLACNPFLTLRSKGRSVEVWRQERREVLEGDPFSVLRELMSGIRVARKAGSPPLIAGAIGYFGYDLGRFVERIPDRTVDDVPVADCHVGFYGAVVAVDHIAGRAFVSAIGAPETDANAARRLAERRAGELAELVSDGRRGSATPALQRERPGGAPPVGGWPSYWAGGTLLPYNYNENGPAALRLSADGRPTTGQEGRSCPTGAELPISSNFTHDQYIVALRQVKEYIAAGDIYQANLSQRLSAPLASTPFDLYRRLTAENPAPFAGYLETPDAAVVCCSPERFIQVRGDEVETRPIKGTRPRGATPEEDARLAAELLASEKDRAENVMIVDLERNDLGRVCQFGSVHVPELFALESYATVHHLVSTVRGRLRKDATALDCLRASFPGGSITGAPKVRSMEIIEELEPTRRGIYTGAIGYVCFSGDMDVNIVIRTVVVKDGVAHFQVGGGIVADSDPEAEYQETIDKGQALARALAAEAGTEKMRWPA